MNFDEWINYVFDRPVAAENRDAWYWQDDAEGNSLNWWEPEPGVIADYLARLLESPRFLMDRFDEHRVAQGLEFIFGVGSSQEYWNETENKQDDPDWFSAGYCRRALHLSVPIFLQERWLRGIYILYRDLFVRCCVNWFGLESLPGDPEHVGALNNPCWMLWDLDDLHEVIAMPRFLHLVDPAFEVLGQTLQLPSAICQAGALHGLGHLQPYFPNRVRDIIDAFLRDRSDLHPNVARYAEEAREGDIQ